MFTQKYYCIKYECSLMHQNTNKKAGLSKKKPRKSKKYMIFKVNDYISLKTQIIDTDKILITQSKQTIYNNSVALIFQFYGC